MCCLILLFSIGCDSDNTDKQTKIEIGNIETVSKIVSTYDTLLGFSGAILVGKGDSIIYQNASGFADVKNKIPNTVNTKFRLASLTKQFTAAALLILEQNGKVDFEKPISNYLKELNPEIADRINIHQILSHSSGLARDIEPLTEDELGQNYISIDQVIQLISTSELEFRPGKRWSYSNLGYNIGAKIIESVTGMEYGEAMDSLIFKPLNMQNTAHEKSSDNIDNMAIGHVALPDRIIKAAYEDKSYVIGAGSIYSTVNDMFIWTRELLSEGNGNLLSEISKAKLFTKQEKRYSYGWFIDTYVWQPVNKYNEATNPHHEGGSPGFESKVSILTQHKSVVIVLSNKLPSNLSGITNRVTNSILGFDDGPPKLDGSKQFYEKLFTNGINSADSLINAWKTSERTYLMPDKNDVYLVGRGYMDALEYEKATLIMDFLIKTTPKWSYPYLFKAMMLEEQNEIKQAKAAYEKVLEIEPGQSNAKIRLKNLQK